MKNIARLLLLPCTAITVLYGCTKLDSKRVVDNSSILSVMESYYNFSKVKPDGTFMFESNVMNNDPTEKNTALVGGLFYDKNGSLQNGGGTISIGGYQLTPKGGQYGFDKILPRDSLYGKNVTFVLRPPSRSSTVTATGSPSGITTHGTGTIIVSDPIVTATLYSPIPINVTNVDPQAAPMSLLTNTLTPLTWNADPNNVNGVVIIAQYLPMLFANQAINALGFNTVIRVSELVPDNGSTTLDPSFFSKFPKGGQLMLFVGRGNYTTASDGTYNYQVGGYTATAVYAINIPYPKINGANSFVYTAASSGTITGAPGQTITVTMAVNSVGKHPGGAFSYFNISGSTLQIPVAKQSALANISDMTGGSATFVMPASGSVNWTGTFTTTPPSSVTISVQ